MPAKLSNLASLNYPPEEYEVIIVSDGSTDATNTILETAANDKLRVIVFPTNRGKAVALNSAVTAATGEVLVFTDARQSIQPEAIRYLVSNFADSSVGCVSGNLRLKPAVSSTSNGLGLYWQFEKLIRQLEAATGSAVGATGSLYAIRRTLTVPIPPGTLLDDVYLPVHVVRQGKRVIFEPQAVAWDSLQQTKEREFRRKVRTLIGNYQLVRLDPWLLTPNNPFLFRFVSHKMLRLTCPLFLAGLFLSSLMHHGSLYFTALVIQIVFYFLAVAALMHPRTRLLKRGASVASAFVLLNAAATIAFVYFVSGKREVWTR